jgi:hypothetical protein
VFYHFPVNVGFLSVNSNTWKKVDPEFAVLSCGGRKIKRIREKEGPTAFVSDHAIEAGRFYYEVRFSKLSETSKA